VPVLDQSRCYPTGVRALPGPPGNGPGPNGRARWATTFATRRLSISATRNSQPAVVSTSPSIGM